MKKAQIFLCSTVIALSIVLLSPSPIAAQGYFLKKNEGGGFFGRLFGKKDKENGSEQETQKNPSRSDIKSNTRENARSQRRSSSSIPNFSNQAPTVLPPVTDTPPPNMPEINLSILQQQTMGECTDEDRALFENFSQTMDSMIAAGDEASKSPSDLKVPKGIENIDPNDEDAQEQMMEIIQEEYADDPLIQMTKNTETLQTSIEAMMRCKDWSKIEADRDAYHQKLEQRKKDVARAQQGRDYRETPNQRTRDPRERSLNPQERVQDTADPRFEPRRRTLEPREQTLDPQRRNIR